MSIRNHQYYPKRLNAPRQMIDECAARAVFIEGSYPAAILLARTLNSSATLRTTMEFAFYTAHYHV